MADAISRLPTTGMDESPLSDDVAVLTTTNAQPKRDKTKKTANIWHRVPGADGLGTVKHTLPEDSQVQHGTGKENPITASKVLTENANDPIVGELPIL